MHTTQNSLKKIMLSKNSQIHKKRPYCVIIFVSKNKQNKSMVIKSDSGLTVGV